MHNERREKFGRIEQKKKKKKKQDPIQQQETDMEMRLENAEQTISWEKINA